MKISPSYQLCVLSEEEYNEKMPQISSQLSACAQEGTFQGFDGVKLYYEYFQAQDSHGAVVIVHGLSEFTKKYHEFAWYFLNQGYDVFLYDQRCHGRSARLTARKDLIHVDNFADYTKDLHCFVNNVVRKVTDKPLYLYGHSMGGAISARYLARYPEVFRKAVLSAPMIQPMTRGVPVIVAQVALTFCVWAGQGKKKFWGADEFDSEYPFERTHDRSRARFERNMQIRRNDEHYCTTPQSIRWVQGSVLLRSKLTGKGFLRKIKTPILMICGELDTVVRLDAQLDFEKNCPACRRVVLNNATHSMICGTQETITEYVTQVLEHFR